MAVPSFEPSEYISNNRTLAQLSSSEVDRIASIWRHYEFLVAIDRIRGIIVLLKSVRGIPTEKMAISELKETVQKEKGKLKELGYANGAIEMAIDALRWVPYEIIEGKALGLNVKWSTHCRHLLHHLQLYINENPLPQPPSRVLNIEKP